jgi:formate/nitrite transporter FocA (FNT family)
MTVPVFQLEAFRQVEVRFAFAAHFAMLIRFMAKNPNTGLSRSDRDKANERTGIRSPLIYEVVRREGDEELSRPLSSLSWSGFAAGIALSFSIYGKAFLHNAVGDASWGPVVSNFGYSLGFLMVVMGRLQLFTENTITAVLPLLADFNRSRLICMVRLWIVVFLTNMAGSFLSALCAMKVSILPDKQVEAVIAVSEHLLDYSAYQSLAYGVPAGFLIAALVWLMPAARGSAFWVIISLTYLISVGGLTHVVAGSTEWFALVLEGRTSWLHAVVSGIFPALVGNIIGGTGLFALISYGQVREEL